jgi:hypothetical protein
MHYKQLVSILLLPIALGQWIDHDYLEPRMLRTGVARLQQATKVVGQAAKALPGGPSGQRDYNTLNWQKAAEKYNKGKPGIQAAEAAAKDGITHMEKTAGWDPNHDYSLR